MRAVIASAVAAGTVAAPPSKSLAHRLLLCGALAQGQTVLAGMGENEDILATADCVRQMGAGLVWAGDTLTVTGTGGRIHGGSYFCRESGSTLRFLLPLALCSGEKVCFTGSPRLMERGVEVYRTVLGEKGIAFSCLPAEVRATGRLSGGMYVLPGNISSQFITGLLYALPLCEADSTLRVLPPLESRGYLEMTLSVLARAGIRIERAEDTVFRIPGGQRYCPGNARVEGDWSAAAFLLALNALGGRVRVQGLSVPSLQGDSVCAGLFDPAAQPLFGVDLADCPDLGPVCFAVAAARGGGSFTGTRRLRIKESDRAAAMAEELGKFGIRMQVEENAVTVLPGTLHKPQTALCGHNDHRIVMALAVLCTRTGGTIEGAQAVRKSYPDFFRDLACLGVPVRLEETEKGETDAIL